MNLAAYEAIGLFVLWLVQFLVPSLRHEMLWVYSAWIVVELGLVVAGKKKMPAFAAFGRAWKRRK